MLTGTVRKWDEKRGFGFITSDVGDFYFKATAWKAAENIKQHFKVQFYTTEIPANSNYENANCSRLVFFQKASVNKRITLCLVNLTRVYAYVLEELDLYLKVRLNWIAYANDN